MAVFCEYTKVAKNKPVYDKLTVHVQISFLAIRYPNIQRAVNKQELNTPGHDLCFPCEAIRAFPILKSLINNWMGREDLGPGGIWGRVQGVGSDQ